MTSMPDAAAPAEPPAAPTPAPAPFQVHAWPRALRLLGVAAQAVHAGNLLHLAWLIAQGFLDGEIHAPPIYVATRLVLFSLLPLGLVRALRAWCRASVGLSAEHLVLQLRGVRFEVPYSSIDAVRPWRLPLPAPALGLRLKSGRVFPYALEPAAPLPLLDALGQHGAPTTPAAAHPVTRFADARAHVKRRWWHLALKYGVFPLIPALIFFRAHQYIAFGGPFGQWQQLGLASYLRTLVLDYWVGVLTYMLLYAGLWRGLGGLLAFAGAWVAPSRARGARRLAEWVCGLAYYVGVPALILARFFL
ncbi:hypothetical protein P2318_14445 [Myxococcaceae bacterium GXIMD 01537]